MGQCCMGRESVGLGEVPDVVEQDLADNTNVANEAATRFSAYEMTLPVWRTDLTYFYNSLIKAEIKDEEGKGTEKTSIERLQSIL